MKVKVRELESADVLDSSPFANTYGALELIKTQDDKVFLKMEDCTGCEYFGPLTDEQVKAYRTLCDVKSADVDYELNI